MPSNRSPHAPFALHSSPRRTPLALAACAVLLPTGVAVAQATTPAEASAPAATAAPQAIEIVGRRQSGQYLETRSEGATRTDTPLIEVPQAVRVVPRQLLDDLGALKVDDVLDYVAGASRHNNFGGTWDNIAIRGFQGHQDTTMSLLRNGMASNRGFNAPRDTANVERIEFLKGTMGALYGSSEPGGTVNLVTKQPRFTAGHSVEAYYGSHDYKRLALDSTGPVDLRPDDGEPADLAYRLNVSAEDKDSFRDHVQSTRTLVAPALTWRFSPDTTLRYDGEWLRQQAPLDRGVPAVGGRLGSVPVSNFYSPSNDGDIAIDNQTHQLFVEHTLGEQWTLRGGLQFKRGTLQGYATEPTTAGTGCSTAPETSGWLCRRLRYRDFTSDETSAQLDLVGTLRTGAIEHQLLIGAEAAEFGQDRTLLSHAASLNNGLGIPVADPPYAPIERPALGAAIPAWNGRLDDSDQAIYVQDQVALTPALKLLAGLRHDRASSRFASRADGSVAEQDVGATSPRLGLAWLIQPGLSAYASIGRSFRAQTETDAEGRMFEPQRGTAKELGLKWEARDGRLGASLALFDITKTHVPQYVAETDSYVELDEVRNRGLELEMAGWVAPGWRVALAYAYLDADPHLTQFARNTGSLFVVHEMNLGGRGLVGLGGGVTHVGRRTGEDAFSTPPELPAYTVAKLTAYWSVTPQLRLSLDIDNLFDRRYYASAYNRLWVTPGSPRSAVAGVQYKF
jgi:iron complex outermembrane receptor protein